MNKLLLLFLFGGLGTLARYGLSGLTLRITGTSFPWGTFAVNALGCFLFGLLWILAEERGLLPPTWRLYALTGFMGAFTTFSTYMYESEMLIQGGQWAAALANLLGQVAIGFIAMMIGFAAGRLI